MSSAGPAYEIRFRDDEHVQIIDLTRNGAAPESRPLPSIYRQSCLLRRESVMLSHSTSEPTFSSYDIKDTIDEKLMNEDNEVSSLAVNRENTGPTGVPSQPIAIRKPASSETQLLAKSAPHKQTTSNTYHSDYNDTSFSWTGQPNKKNLDVIPTVARRLAEDEALDSLRRQEGEEAMRKAQERKAKIAAARQHARKRSDDASHLKDGKLSKSPQEDLVLNPRHKLSSSANINESSANEAMADYNTTDHKIPQDNHTIDIQKAVDSYRPNTKNMYNADKLPTLDSQPNVYPYKSQPHIDAYLRQPPKGYLGDTHHKERPSALNTHNADTLKYEHGHELSKIHEGQFQIPSMTTMNKDKSSQYLSEDAIKAEENQNCCCIIS